MGTCGSHATVSSRTPEDAAHKRPAQPRADNGAPAATAASLAFAVATSDGARRVLQRAPAGDAPANPPPIVHEVLSAPGAPLDAATRIAMEARLGGDLSGVRVHTDERASASARAVNAVAYTVGRSIVFDRGSYAPHESAGRELLTHELVHTIQQGGGEPAPGGRRLTVDAPDSPAEHEAQHIAATSPATAANASVTYPPAPGRGKAAPPPRRLDAPRRTPGNARAGRVLARKPGRKGAGTPLQPPLALRPSTFGEQWIMPPYYDRAEKTVAWAKARVGARARDAIAVIQDGIVTLYCESNDESWTYFNVTQPVPLRHGVWRFEMPNTPGPFPLLDTGAWGTALLETGNSPEDLVPESRRQNFRALLPDAKNVLYVVYPEALMEVTVHAERPERTGVPQWATNQVKTARALVQAAADAAAPPPTKVTVWHKDDVDWFVDVWLGGDVRSLKLKAGESAKELAERIKHATGEMRAEDDPSRSTRIKGTKEGDPQFEQHKQAAQWASMPGDAKKPIGELRPNAPPFPARIYSMGPEGQGGNDEFEHTVKGASVSFVMDLNYAAVTSGFWEEFGARFQSIDYQWELFDLTKVKLGAVKAQLGRSSSDIFKQILELRQSITEAPDGDAKTQAQAELAKLEDQLRARGDEPDSGGWRDVVRDWGNTLEDTEADFDSVLRYIPGVNIAFAALVGISDLVQFLGAPLKVGFAELASPTNLQKIAWLKEGTFLLRCWAQPVIRQRDIDKIHQQGLEAIIRPPSVAYLPVRVSAIDKRSQEANDVEMARIQNLKDELAKATERDAREDIQEELDWAGRASQESNVGALEVARQRAQRELDRIEAWKQAQKDDIPVSLMLSEPELKLRRWKARLDIAGIDLDAYKMRLEAERASLRDMEPRLGWGLDPYQGEIYRPRMTIVSELDGRVLPIVANLVQDKASKTGSRAWRLIDVSSEDTKRPYVGKGATHNEAINAAFKDFKQRCGYGRGTISIRLPENLKAGVDGETIYVPAQMRASPGIGERFEKRLQDLATAAEVASLFVTGPIGVGLGIGGGMLGAGLAIKNFGGRMAAGKQFFSYETGMDALAVIGAFVAVAGGAAKSVRLAALAKRARWVGTTLHVVGTGVMAGQVIAIPMGLYLELQHIEDEERMEQTAAAGKPIDRGKYTARRLEAFARAIKSGVVTVRTIEMARDPELGWNPLEKKAPGGKGGGGPKELTPGTKELLPAAKEATPAAKELPPAAKEATPAGGHSPTPVVDAHAPLRAAEVAGEIAPGHAERVVKAAGDWKTTLKKLLSKFGPAESAQAAKELTEVRANALEHEYQKASAAHGCEPFDVGTVGFDSDVDATMIPRERVRGFSGKERSIGEQIRASARAAQQVINGLRSRFGGYPDAVLDVSIHAYVGEDLAPQYASAQEAGAARAHDTAVSFAEARRGMTRDQWKAFEAEFETRLGHEKAQPAERQMLERIKGQMVEGFGFKAEMEALLGEYVRDVIKQAKGPVTAEEVRALAFDQIVYDRRQKLAEAFEQTPLDWVKINRLRSEIRWFSPGAYASDAAFTHAVKHGQVRREAGASAAKARGSTKPTREEVGGELNPNLDAERWVSPQERASRLANAATGNVGELGRHPHGGEAKNRAKDAAKYAGRALEVAEAMGGPIRHGALENALRAFKQSKWASDATMRDAAVARWAREARGGKGVARAADGTLTISDDTYTAFADAAEQWLMRSAVESRIHEGALADQDQVPARPTPKPGRGAARAIGLSDVALDNVLAVMAPETAVAVAGWLGRERLEAMSSRPERLKLLLEAHARLADALADPEALAGLRRLTEADPKLPGAQKGLGAQKILDAILQSNADNLRLALRVFGRPDMQDPGNHPQRRADALPAFSEDRTLLEVIDRRGARDYNELARNRSVLTATEERLATLEDPAARAAVIDSLLAADTTRQRRELLGIYTPRKQRIKEIKAVESDATERQEALDDATAFLDDPKHAEVKRPNSDQPYSTMTEAERDAFIKARATLMQVREEIANPKNYEKYQKYSQAAKERLINQMDALGKKAGIIQNWNPRARVAEALWVRGGGFNQKRIPNPVFPAKTTGAPGFTQLDGVYPAVASDNPVPGTRTWVEFKSHLDEHLTEGTARSHARDGFADWHALLHDKTMRDDAMAIHYARIPNDADKVRMAAQLLGPKSPFKALKFGDEPWIMRPDSTPMPEPLALPAWWNDPR
jgi:hypothetical protein